MKVYAVSPKDRSSGIESLLAQYDLEKFRKKKVAMKANFNSADPFPASTHPETLKALLTMFSKLDCNIVLAERSGMGETRKNLEKLHIFELVSQYNGEVVVIDSLEKDEVSLFHGEHWSRGFLLASVFLEVDYVVSTCCLKPHRFGGYFTLSLKNSVGAVVRYSPDDKYDYMSELHQSPHQRTMIAEINRALPCDLAILDGIKGFSTMGPEQGTLIEPNLLLASTDRIALDVVGIAVLRHYGTTPEVEKGNIFEQEQIKRASELGIGVKSADEIEIVPLDEESSEFFEAVEFS